MRANREQRETVTEKESEYERDEFSGVEEKRGSVRRHLPDDRLEECEYSGVGEKRS